jgi:hypothetical protein
MTVYSLWCFRILTNSKIDVSCASESVDMQVLFGIWNEIDGLIVVGGLSGQAHI